MNKLNNIVLFDIDGTLSYKGVIPLSAINTIKKFRENGDLVFIASGRNAAQLDQNIKEIEFDGAILNNGGYALINGQEIYKSSISKDVIKRLLNENCCLGLLTEDDYVTFSQDSKLANDFCDFFSIVRPRYVSSDFLNDHEFYSLGAYSEKSLDFLKEKYPEICFVKVNSSGYDVFNKGVSKATPIKELRKLFPTHKIIAFGDNYNDKEMLLEADIAIVMGSAPDEIKALGDFVTLDVLNDGICYAYEKYLKF